MLSVQIKSGHFVGEEKREKNTSWPNFFHDQEGKNTMFKCKQLSSYLSHLNHEALRKNGSNFRAMDLAKGHSSIINSKIIRLDNFMFWAISHGVLSSSWNLDFNWKFSFICCSESNSEVFSEFNWKLNWTARA